MLCVLVAVCHVAVSRLSVTKHQGGAERARAVGAAFEVRALARAELAMEAAESSTMTVCKNCRRYSPVPYVHSFSASLDQCKNQSWHTSNPGWIVTPTSSEAGTAAVSNAAFCSGECLYSFLFSRDLLSSKSMEADAALHFFKRTDIQKHPAMRDDPLWEDHPGEASSSASVPEDVASPSDSFAPRSPSRRSPSPPERQGSGQVMGGDL